MWMVGQVTEKSGSRYQISAVTNGVESITFLAEGIPGVSFTLPEALPSGQYLVRMEAIALHVAQTYGVAQFYVSCGQVGVTGGGNGTPSPSVAIPGFIPAMNLGFSST